MLAADAQLEIRLDTAGALDGDPHQIADALQVERLERVPLEDPDLEVVGEEPALGVVAREAERRLREVVRAEGAEVRHLRDLVRADASARQLDHRAAEVLDRRLLSSDALRQLAQPAQLLPEPDERMHDLDEWRLPSALRHRACGTNDGAHLHLVDLGVLQPEPAAAGAQHRILLAQLLRAAAHLRCHAPRPRSGGTRAAVGRAGGS